MRRLSAILLVTILVFSIGTLVLKGFFPSIASGSWGAVGTMSEARTGAGTAVMYDGRILVTGGKSPDGTVLSSVEVFNADGSFSSAAPMHVARTGHTATWLADGYVLVTGGTVSGGGVTNCAEMYDPLSNTWTTLAATLADARTGHTATALDDGNVLFAGGENSYSALSSVEVFDLVHETFKLAGVMSSERKAHAAAALQDGRVLLIGGTDANGTTLKSMDIFDQQVGIIAGPTMTTPRASATATTLLDGTVLIAGGRDPEGAGNKVSELNSAEIFNPSTGKIRSAGSNMISPRADHMALLLPNNNSVLLIGGKLGANDLLSAEMFVPWTGQFKDAGMMTASHTGGVSDSLTFLDGFLLAAGGSNQAKAEVYRFATLKTDAVEYVPGQTVVISGSGWRPSETVHLNLYRPGTGTSVQINAVADLSGNIYDTSFATTSADFKTVLLLTATGAASQAQLSFADAANLTVGGTVQDQFTSVGIAGAQIKAFSNVGLTTQVGSTVTTTSTGQFNLTLSKSATFWITMTPPATYTAISFTPDPGGATTRISNTEFSVSSGSSGGSSPANVFVVHSNVQTITVGTAAPASAAYGSTFTVSATATSGLAVTYASSGSCSNVGPTFTITSGTGVCTVTYSQAGDSNVNPAPNVTNTTNATPKDATITPTSGQSKVYGTSDPVLTFTNDGGLAAGAFTGALSRVAGENVGDYAITLGALSAGSNYSLSLASTVNFSITAKMPTITWVNPADITYGTALGATQLNATASTPGTFAYTPAAGTVLNAGAGQTLSVTFTPTDTANYATATKSVTINVNQATPAITWATPADIAYGTALSATQLNASSTTPGTFAYTPASGVVLNAGAGQTLSVTFTPTDTANYATTAKSVTISVNKAVPTITWSDPADITYGTALDATQLNATASIPGTFVYAPAAGAVLNAGSGQTLSVTFTPNDAANYTTAAKSVSINVSKGTPTITWANPADITYGTALGATQLNATASTPGTFAYTPAAGTILNTGSGQTLSATFTPTDTANYTTSTKGVTINVNKATPTITWANPVDITYGTALGATQLNATSSTPGTFAYTPAAGTVLNAGAAQTLSVTFTPTDGTNYTTGTKSVALNVNKATPTITWANPADINYGTALDATQLNASSSTPGTFAYTPAAGTMLNVGAGQTLSTSFTPTDAANYTTAMKSVSINVNKGTPTITWSNPADITYGTALSATQLNATSSTPGTFAYTPVAGTVLNAGPSQTLSVTFTPTDTTNYNTATATVSINVSKGTPTVTWANPGDITYGTPLSATQLNATVDGGMAGTIVYTPSTGTVLNAGPSQRLSATFTPTDAVNFPPVTKTVTINVLKAIPTVNITGGTFPYDGAAHPATATVKGVGGVDLGAATITYAPGGVVPVNTGTYTATADFVGDTNYSPASATATIMIEKVDSTIVWTNPTDIVYGTALGAGQLNATASVPGTFTYTPATGAVLGAGSHVLHADFEPADSTNYKAKSANVQINVSKAPTQTTWVSIVPFNGVVVGQPVTFTFKFAPPVGGVAPTGVIGVFEQGVGTPLCTVPVPATAQTLSCTAAFNTLATHNVAPVYQGDANYEASNDNNAGVALVTGRTTTTVSSSAINVAAGATVTLTSTTAIDAPGAGTLTGQVMFLDNGVAFSTTPTIDATGHASFTTPALTAGSHSFVAEYLSDASFGASSSEPVLVTATKTTPVITWPNPAAIVYGTPLSTTQLNASSTTSGTFAYTPAAGTVFGVGGHTLSVTFTPTDGVAYESVTQSVSLNVVQATLTATAVNTARVYGGGNPSFTYQVTGFVNNDTMSALTAAPVCSSAAIATSPVAVPIAITCSGAAATNYAFNYVPGVLTITPAPLTVTPNNASRPQGQANPALSGTIVGIKNGDLITATYSTTALDSSPVGTYPITAAVSDNGNGALLNYSVISNIGTLTVTSAGTDLVESAIGITGAVGSGLVVQVTDTLTNTGSKAAGSSSTRYYLSKTLLKNNGVSMSGIRNVGGLGGGSSSTGSAMVTIPIGTAAGAYNILVCADDTFAVPETDETNNCAPVGVTVVGLDLTESNVSVTGTAAAGLTVQVTDTVSNSGPGITSSSTTRYYLSKTLLKNNGVLMSGIRNVGTLSGGLSSTGSATVTIPAGTAAGAYNILACTDDLAAVPEVDETNNCALTGVTVVSLDLTESNVSVTGVVAPGLTVQVTETVSNSGPGTAGGSSTRFYLSKTLLKNNGVSMTGLRSVGTLAGGTGSTGTTTVTIPIGTAAGAYNILACADDTFAVPESDEANNCSSAAVTVVGLDLTESNVSITGATTPGATVQVTDTVSNSGPGIASSSSTRYYLSKTLLKSNGVSMTGLRSVGSLSGGASSTGSTMVTIPIGTAVGAYNLLVCADDQFAVPESDETNNCAAVPVTVSTN